MGMLGDRGKRKERGDGVAGERMEEPDTSIEVPQILVFKRAG